MSGERPFAVTNQLEPNQAAELLLRLERGYQRAHKVARAAFRTPEHHSRRQLANDLNTLSLDEFDATLQTGARQPGESVERMLARTAITSSTPELAARDLARDAVTEETVRVRANTPEDFLSILPVLLGYQPDEGDVVLTGLNEQGRVVVTARFAQPTPEDFTGASLEPMLSNIQRQGVQSMMVTGYGPGQLVTPAVDKLTALVDPLIRVRDALRVEGDRYWSYGCQEPSCCPPDGIQFQAETAASTTMRVESGRSVEASRANLAEWIAPPTGKQAEAARQAWTEALARPLSVAEGRAAVDQALQDCRAGRPIDNAKAAQLAATLRGLPVRDHAWAHMKPEYRKAHTNLWAGILRQVPPEAAAAPASLLAFTAWQQGEGAYANLAIERALEADPDYSMAHLLRQAITAGAPPTVAVPPMTPEEVARAYRERELGTIEPELEAGA